MHVKDFEHRLVQQVFRTTTVSFPRPCATTYLPPYHLRDRFPPTRITRSNVLCLFRQRIQRSSEERVYLRYYVGEEERGRQFTLIPLPLSPDCAYLRDCGRGHRWGREAGPADRRKLRRRPAADREDERRIWPISAWGRKGALHPGEGARQRLLRSGTGPRHSTRPHPKRRDLHSVSKQ